MNDEDLLGLTFKDKYGLQVASLDVLDWFFESTLRYFLKFVYSVVLKYIFVTIVLKE